MTDRKLNWVAVGLAVLALLVVFFRPAKNIVQQVSNGEPVNVGALASPALGPWYSVGGAEVFGSKIDLIQASTTGVICAIQNGKSTSTLAWGSVFSRTSTSSATTLTIAKATSPSATTTLLGGQTAVQAGDQISAIASSSTLFLPNEWFVAALDGGTANVSATHKIIYQLTGDCQAVFHRIAY